MTADRRSATHTGDIERTPRVAVEILPPATRGHDRRVGARRHAEFGTAHTRLVDPTIDARRSRTDRDRLIPDLSPVAVCGQAIARGELRFGERMPNPHAEGEMTLWFHLPCAAYKRPEPLLEALAESGVGVGNRAKLEATARATLGHRRLPRIDGAERASSGKARCHAYREPIERGARRVMLAYFEGARVAPGGFVHLACRQAGSRRTTS